VLIGDNEILGFCPKRLLFFILYSDVQSYWRNEEPRQPEI